MTTAAEIAAALAAARRGWPVFPVSSNKRPLIKWGDGASTDIKIITDWWRRWPQALVGVPTGRRSGFVVLDVDVKDGRNGFDTLADLGGAILPDTPMVHTRSGGVHIYFAHIDVEIRNSVGKYGLGVGLDVRGDGGFVVVPSLGSGYWWDPHCNFDTVALVPAPAWLGHRERPERPSANRHQRFDPQACLDEACQLTRTAPDGEKYHTLNREVFSVATLVAAGRLAEADARRALAVATDILIAHSNADRKQTWETLERAFADGHAAPRRARR
jgi:hypothetical protein